MFKDENAAPQDPMQSDVSQISRDIDEIKRYVAGTYASVDTEINEIRDLCQRIERKLNETDRQVDKIESYERAINDIKASVQRMERKIK